MTRDEIARDLDKLATNLVLVVGAIERLADDLRRPDEPQSDAPSVQSTPDRTDA